MSVNGRGHRGASYMDQYDDQYDHGKYHDDNDEEEMSKAAR